MRLRRPFLIGCFLLWSIARVPASAQPAIHLSADVERGFYDAPFTVALTADARSAAIRYTTDGSLPTPSHGAIYTDPISVATTTVLRAVAFTGQATSAVTTHSYLFLHDVARQPAEPEGRRRPSFQISNKTRLPLDYEMDPRVVDDPRYSADLLHGLRAIPSLSLAMDEDEFWDVVDDQGEYPVSVEVLYPDAPGQHEHVDGGLEAHSHRWMKRSFRLVFRDVYGPTQWTTRLMQSAPFHGESATSRFNRLVLRAGNNRSWARDWNPDRTTYTRDQWYRDTQLDMAGYGARGTFVHLYVNGLYWGLFNPTERPDDAFAAAYFGGEREDWFTVNRDGPKTGVPTRWDYLTGTLVERDLSDPAAYAEVREFLDVEAFSDYLILSWMIGVSDWPENNYWAGHRMDPVGPIRFYAWDAEWSWDVTLGSNNGAWVHPFFRRGWSRGPEIAKLWQALIANPEFMALFADRVYRHTRSGGALSDDRSRERWAVLNESIRDAVVAESARWGDTMGPLRERDVHWQREVDRLDSLMNGNVHRFLEALREHRYYPMIDPPLFNRQGGELEAGFSLTMTDPNGSGAIYYTTNGDDPREAGTVYTGPLVLNGRQTIRARVRDGDTWSALARADFYSVQPLADLVIHEIMYHAADPGGDDLDFVELHNRSDQMLDLTDLRFTTGLRYTFPADARMPPGGFLVLAEDSAAFTAHYGTAPFGQYAGRLSNAGEPLTLADPLDRIVDNIHYGDEKPWDASTDGGGSSLELMHPSLDNGEPEHWAASPQPGGSPGAPNSGHPPYVTLTRSAHSATLPTGAAPTFEGVVVESGKIVRLELVDNGHVVWAADSVAGSPFRFTFTYTGISDGLHALTAVATDDDSLRGTSNEITVTVGTPCDPAPSPLVISEINYHAPSDADDGDWIELFNPDTVAADLSGWIFKNAQGGQRFVLPDSTVLTSHGYLVLAQDVPRFTTVHADSVEAIGSFGFDLNQDEDLLRFYSARGCLVDSVRYTGRPPWAEVPHEATLALRDPYLNNDLAANWATSIQPGGTPGSANPAPPSDPDPNPDANPDPEHPDAPSDGVLVVTAPYPNPTSSRAVIELTVPEAQTVRVALYDALGRERQRIFDGVLETGRPHALRLNAAPLPNGIYFVRIDGALFTAHRTLTVVR